MKNNDGEIHSIAIMRLSALGDVVWTIPMVEQLKKKFPQAKITYFCSRPFSDVLKLVSGIDIKVIKKPKTVLDYLSLQKQLSKYNFDILLCTQANLRVNFLYSFISAKRKIGFDKKRGRDFQHFFTTETISFEKEHSLLAFLRFSKLIGCSTDVEYNLDLSSFSFEIPTQRDFIVIHPKASSPIRTWSTKNYISLINKYIEATDYDVILTGGPGDTDIVDEVFNKCQSSRVINLCAKTSIPELGVIFKKSRLVIACDSGPIHLANALGVKVLGLYVSLPTYYTGPYGQEENCIDKYEYALKKFYQLDAKLNWRKRVKHKEMMSLISVDEVFSKSIQLLT